MRSPFSSHLSPFKVGVIGPESTGKTTLARYLARRYNGTYVPEYARTYVEQRVGNGGWRVEDITWDELCEIARHQIEELKNLSAQRSQLCIFDTELIVTKIWFEYAFGRVPEWLDEAIRLYPMDVYLLTYPDLPWVPDPARSNGSDAIRMELYKKYEAGIRDLGIPYYIIRHTAD